MYILRNVLYQENQILQPGTLVYNLAREQLLYNTNTLCNEWSHLY